MTVQVWNLIQPIQLKLWHYSYNIRFGHIPLTSFKVHTELSRAAFFALFCRILYSRDRYVWKSQNISSFYNTEHQVNDTTFFSHYDVWWVREAIDLIFGTVLGWLEICINKCQHSGVHILGNVFLFFFFFLAILLYCAHNTNTEQFPFSRPINFWRCYWERSDRKWHLIHGLRMRQEGIICNLSVISQTAWDEEKERKKQEKYNGAEVLVFLLAPCKRINRFIKSLGMKNGKKSKQLLTLRQTEGLQK